MIKKKVAVHIQSEVQYFSLAPLLKELEGKYAVKVVLDMFDGNTDGYNEMSNAVVKILKDAGLHPVDIREVKDELFDVYLTSYIDGIVKSKCYLKYEYGTLNIKPSLTYVPEVMEGFHGFLCQSTVTNELLKVYGMTFPVENLRFAGLKRKEMKSEKPVVLFAPTYNDECTDEEMGEVIKVLKKKYYVIVKSHHGTSFLKENSSKKQALVNNADEYYDSKMSLSELIMRADVCVFGNSSAIGEALYVNVPCVIFAKDLDYFKMGKMHTTQYYLVKKDVLPWAKNTSEIAEKVSLALDEKTIIEQKRCAEKLFPRIFRTGVDGYIKVIDYFLNDELAREYCELHDTVLAERDKRKKQEMLEIKSRLKESEELILIKEREKQEILEANAKKKLYRLADKLYKIEGRMINGKS